MSVSVPLAELASALEQRAGTVYLLTVADSGRPHCVAVRLGWHGDELEVRTGSTSARNAQARPGVTLLAPPLPPSQPATDADADADTSGYSLIVDGDVTAISVAADGVVVRIQPTHAVFHRPATGPDGAPAHDCVPVLDHAPRPDDRPS